MLLMTSASNPCLNFCNGLSFSILENKLGQKLIFKADFIIIYLKIGVREMAQRLRAEDLDSVHRTYMAAHNCCNSSSKVFIVSSMCVLHACGAHTYTQTHMHMQAYRHTKNNILEGFKSSLRA